jgi:hypothetical protein
MEARITANRNLQERIDNVMRALSTGNTGPRGRYDRALTQANALAREIGIRLPPRRTLRNQTQRNRLINTIFLPRRQRVTNILRIQNRRVTDRAFNSPTEWLNRFNQIAGVPGFDITRTQATRIAQNLTAGERYYITLVFMNGSIVNQTVTAGSLEAIIKILVHRVREDVIVEEGSDLTLLAKYLAISTVHITRVERLLPSATVRGGGSKRKAVGWFRYLNGSDIDLTDYQIFSENDEREDVSCLLFTLDKLGISQNKLQEICGAIGASVHITQTKLQHIAELLEQTIEIIRESDGKNKSRSNTYGKQYKDKETLKIGEIDGHLFQINQTHYTAFYIKNKKAIDDYTDDPKRFSYTNKKGKWYATDRPKFLSSFQLINLLKSLDYFTEYVKSIKPSNLYTAQPSLDNIEADQRPFEKPKPRKSKEYVYYAADIESDVVSNASHTALAISFQQLTDETEPIVLVINSEADDPTQDLFNRFMTSFKDVHGDRGIPVIYFHNAKYDLSLFPASIPVVSEVVKDGSVYSVTLTFFGLHVEIRDSLKYFGAGGGLKNLPKMLDLGSQYEKLEATGYTYHTINNMTSHWIPVAEYAKHVKSSERSILTSESKEESLYFKNVNGITLINPTEYYLAYLRQDVVVLSKALLKFRELIANVTGGIDAFESLTISSIGHKMAVNEGCYEGVFETKGNLRDFIQQAVKGGRVFANPKYKKVVNDSPIQDVDGISLYPASQYRLCDEHGIASGPVSKGGTTFSDYQDKDYYLVKINLKRLNTSISVPQCALKDDNGVLKYRNDWTDQTVYIDRYALEDLIRYQDAQFEILEGVYWNNGYNKGVGKLAERLHNERCKVKSSNPAQGNVLKLLMNSIYGKTIMKRSETETSFVVNKDFNDYLYSNFGVIKEFGDIQAPRVKVIKSTYDNSYSLNHVGVSILSMSKRIMNEVFDVMEQSNMPMIYTDTDSIHMIEADVDKLAENFEAKYGRKLVGKNLGQFHCDFEMKNHDKSSGIDPVSIYNITLGAKSYLDVLRGVDKAGNVVQDIHIRLKGVTEAGINHKLNSISSDRIEAAKTLYEELASGKAHEFVLNPEDSVSFEYFKTGSNNIKIRTRAVNTFKRTLKF